MTDILHRLHCTIRCDIETAASGCHCAAARDEITALRAENERLNAGIEIWKGCARTADAPLAIAHAEIVRQREENERLRAALERMLLEFDFMIEGGVIPDVRNDIIFVEARAAIDGQPAPGKEEA